MNYTLFFETVVPIQSLDSKRTLVHVYTAIPKKNMGISWHLTDDACRESRRPSFTQPTTLPTLCQGSPLTLSTEGGHSFSSLPLIHHKVRVTWRTRPNQEGDGIIFGMLIPHLLLPLLSQPTQTFLSFNQKCTLSCSQSFLLSMFIKWIQWVQEIDLIERDPWGLMQTYIILHVKGKCND